MCLDVALTDGRCEPLVAEEDIVCYKVLFTTAVMLADRVLKKLCESYDADEDAEYMSPYRYAPYDIGKEYTSELDDVWPIHAHSGMVSKGLHTFVDYYEAVHRMNDSGGRHRGAVLVKCRIPKGAMYYKGTYGIFKRSSSYASDRLILDHVIDTTTIFKTEE